MIENYSLTENGDDKRDGGREDTRKEEIRKDIDESTTHERPEPDTEPPTSREEQ